MEDRGGALDPTLEMARNEMMVEAELTRAEVMAALGGPGTGISDKTIVMLTGCWPWASITEIEDAIRDIGNRARAATILEAEIRSVICGSQISGRWIEQFGYKALDGGFDGDGDKGEVPEGYYDTDKPPLEDPQKLIVVLVTDLAGATASYSGPVCEQAGVEPGKIYLVECEADKAADALNSAISANDGNPDSFESRWIDLEPDLPENALERYQADQLVLSGGRWLIPAMWEEYTKEEQNEWLLSVTDNLKSALIRAGLSK
jgi:hypothetical protein